MSLLLKLVKIKKVQVLGVFKTPEEDTYYLLQVKKKHGKIDFALPLIVNNFDQLISKLDRTVPTVLVIDGKGVLNKKIDYKEETDNSWKKSLDPKAIYYTEITASKFSFISFCRRKLIDDQIELLQKKDVQIIDFYLGPLPAIFLHPVIKEEKIYSNHTLLQFNENMIYELKKDTLTEKDYMFDNQTLSKYHLPLYGAALDFFLRLPEIKKTKPESFNEEEIIYKKGFLMLGKAMLIFYLSTLLISYFLTGHFSSKNLELSQKNIFSSQTVKHIQELQEKKEQKLLLLAKTGQLSKHFLNFYTYKLAKSIPSTIEMNVLQIFPVEQEIRSSKKVDIRHNVIICNGITASETAFNKWLNSLKEFKWIEKFEIISLKKDKKNIQHFELKIIVNNV